MSKDNKQRVITFSSKRVIVCVIILLVCAYVFLNGQDKSLESEHKFLSEHGDEIQEVDGEIISIKKVVSTRSGDRKYKHRRKTTTIYGQVLIDGKEEKIKLSSKDTDIYQEGDIITLYGYNGKYYISKSELAGNNSTSIVWYIAWFISIVLGICSALYAFCECLNGYRLRKNRDERES